MEFGLALMIFALTFSFFVRLGWDVTDRRWHAACGTLPTPRIAFATAYFFFLLCLLHFAVSLDTPGCEALLPPPLLLVSTLRRMELLGIFDSLNCFPLLLDWELMVFDE